MLLKRRMGKIIKAAGIWTIAGILLAAPFAAFGHDHHECPASCCAEEREGCCDDREEACTGFPPCDACEAVFVHNATVVASSDHYVRRVVERYPWFLKIRPEPSPGSMQGYAFLSDSPAGNGQTPPGFSVTVLRL